MRLIDYFEYIKIGVLRERFEFILGASLLFESFMTDTWYTS